MKLDEARWLRDVLPRGRTLFRYYKDRYSVQLLRYAVRHETPVSALRASNVAGLLQKPRVRTLLARCNGRLSRDFLQQVDGDPAEESYLLTLGLWRGSQMTRRGANLVLQLNFARSHDRPFRRLLSPQAGVDPFNFSGHPALDDDTLNGTGSRWTIPLNTAYAVQLQCVGTVVGAFGSYVSFVASGLIYNEAGTLHVVGPLLGVIAQEQAANAAGWTLTGSIVGTDYTLTANSNGATGDAWTCTLRYTKAK